MPVQVPSSGTNDEPRVAIVLKGYPRLSETFIAHEIHGLERAGFDIEIMSLRHPTDPVRHAIHERIEAGVLYLPEYLHEEPLRVVRALLCQMSRPRFWSLLPLWWNDWRHDPTRNRLRRIGQALVMATEMRPGTGRIHAHFLHTPGSVARYAAMLRRLPFSLSAHAKDIWTIPDREIREKLADAQWTVCCTAINTEHLRQLAPAAHVELVYHGLDPADVPAIERTHHRDGHDENDPCIILCVARAVEKKGIDILLDGLTALPPRIHWKFIHIGGGNDLERLKARAGQLDLADRIDWRGARSRGEVMAAMQEADIFCLPARIAGDGDRDGLPNVLLEALSQELAVVTTDVGGIGELIEHGENGIIISSPTGDELGKVLEHMVRQPEERTRFGQAGRQRVDRHFSAQAGIDRIARLLREDR